MKSILILILSIWICTSAQALTLGEIRSRVRSQIGDTPAQRISPRFTDSEINTVVNIIQNEIAAQTRLLWGEYSTATVTGQKEYALPSDCLNVEKVSFWISPSTTAFRRIEYKSIDNLDTETPNWQNASSGKPLYYYDIGDRIGLYPPASITYSTTSISLKIEYIKRPDTLSADTDVPFDGYPQFTPYHYLIIMGSVNMLNGVFSADFYLLINKMSREMGIKPGKYWNKQLFER